MSQWTPEDRQAAFSLRELATAHLPALAFQSACRADLFTVLERGPADCNEVAAACLLSPEAAGYLLEALTALRLLERHEGRFTNSPVAARMLVRGKPWCQLEAIAQNRLTLEGLHRWDASLGQLSTEPRQPTDTHERLQALHATALPAAGPVVDLLALGQEERVLDLGGGAGTYLLEMADRCPRFEGFLMERPELCGPLRERLEGSRVAVLAGDFREAPLGTGYSLVLLSHVVNYLTDRELAPLLERAAAALGPGGRVAVHDILLGGRRDALLLEALFALRLLGEGQGQGHTRGAVREAMAGAGLERLEEHDLDPEPAHLLVGWRPPCA